MNVIEFKLCAEDRARLDAIIAGLAKATAPVEAPALAPVLRMGQAEDGTVMLIKPDDHPADAPITHLEPPAPDPVPEVKPIPLGEFQKAIVGYCTKSADMKAKVQALVHAYAPSVSEIPEAKRPEVMAALAKL